MTHEEHADARVPAIDIGATKLAAGLVDGDGEVTRFTARPTPTGDAVNASAVRDAVVALLDEVVGGESANVVAVACAGPLDTANGTVSPVNIPAWRDFPLVRALEQWRPGVRVALANDVLPLAVAEHRFGAGRGAHALLGMVISTGVGGGLVLNGEPFPGPTGNAGHIGHVPVDLDGPPCACGARGCVETYASGPSMLARALQQGWQGDDVPALMAAAGAGDPVAVATVERGMDALAAAILAAAVLCDLDRVVVGGGVAQAGEVVLGPLRDAYHRRAGLDFARRLEIVPAALGAQAGVIGAAALAYYGPTLEPGSEKPCV
jgi:glucokinase